jgi:monofunctional biosynthetic peptidoglycan transglycosylase
VLKKIILILILVGLIPPVWYLADLPNVKKLATTNPESSAIRTHRENQIHARGGKPNSFMVWRSLDRISPHLQHAVVLSEDDTFFVHNGFDFEQIKRAAQTNWERKRFAFGASTLTQQLARTLYLSSHKNLLRKAKEALITRRLEKTLSKKRILELYLNVVEWGPQVYGAEAASLYFYKKSAQELTVDEAISLAIILPSPWRWKPLNQTKFMNQRKADLYDRMIRAKFIPPSESTGTAMSLPLTLDEPATEEENANGGGTESPSAPIE